VTVQLARELVERERPAASYEYARAGLAVMLAILDTLQALADRPAAAPAQPTPQPLPAQARGRR